MNALELSRLDVLTVAYVAMGCRAVLTDEAMQSEAYDRISDGLGETGVIAAAVAHAPLLDRLYTERQDDFFGVHAYEVAEPFGVWFLRQWLDTGSEPGARECERKARELTAACCSG